jgi:haloacetate dehalogenase
VHARCEDYRAGATIDLAHDRAADPRRVACPLLVLWSAQGIGSAYDVRAIWNEEADEVLGRGSIAATSLAEERPTETTAELQSFLEGG